MKISRKAYGRVVVVVVVVVAFHQAAYSIAFPQQYYSLIKYKHVGHTRSLALMLDPASNNDSNIFI